MSPVSVWLPFVDCSLAQIIAEHTGKQHKHVIRDIRVMLDELKKDYPKLDHPLEDKDSRGYTTCFYLNRELTETLLTGYSASARLKVIRRWHELEAQAAKPAELSLLDDDENGTHTVRTLKGDQELLVITC